MQQATYNEALNVARDLIGDSGDEGNWEYARAQVELIADLFGIPGTYLAARKEQVARDLGIPPEAIT